MTEKLKTEYPIPLNDAQEQAAKVWAADDRLWTTQETVEFNLRTFARVILKEQSAAEARGRQQAEQEHQHCVPQKAHQFAVRYAEEQIKLREQAEQARDEAPSKVCAEWRRTGKNCEEFHSVVRAGRDRAEAEATIAALTQALKDYGRHKSLDCAATKGRGLRCTCGFDALTGAQA